jgi:hypothetical protein
VLAACSPADTSSAPQPIPTQSRVAAAPPSTTKPSGSATKTQTSRQLKQALLAPGDISRRTEVSSPSDDRATYAGASLECDALAAQLNVERPSGSVVQAGESLSGGEQGPFVDQELHAMRTAGEASALVEGYRRAAAGCTELDVSYGYGADSTVDVSAKAVAGVDGRHVALSFHATDGELDGFDYQQVHVQRANVVVSLTFVATSSDEVQSLTKEAVAKVQKKLVDRPS